MVSICDIVGYFCCFCVAIVVAIAAAAAAVVVGVRLSYLVLGRSSCVEACYIFVWDQLMWCLALMLMISG